MVSFYAPCSKERMAGSVVILSNSLFAKQKKKKAACGDAKMDKVDKIDEAAKFGRCVAAGQQRCSEKGDF